MNINKFYTAYTYLEDIFGITIPEDIFETMAYVAWGKIGNKQTRMYNTTLTPQQDKDSSWFVELPCNVDIIEAVTTGSEDYQRTSNRNEDNGMISSIGENYVESNKYGLNDHYLSGEFIKYRQLGDRLYFTNYYPVINVLYKGIYLDDEGLPYLNDKEVHALATYCAFSQKYKEGIQTKDQATIQLAQLLKQDWNKACSQARVPDYINQNEMDEILNANSSWNRKLYNKSFKVIQ